MLLLPFSAVVTQRLVRNSFLHFSLLDIISFKTCDYSVIDQLWPLGKTKFYYNNSKIDFSFESLDIAQYGKYIIIIKYSRYIRYSVKNSSKTNFLVVKIL